MKKEEWSRWLNKKLCISDGSLLTFNYGVIPSNIVHLQAKSFEVMSAQHPGITGEGLTYDDVLLIPDFSDVCQREVDPVTRFSHSIHQINHYFSVGMEYLGLQNIEALKFARFVLITRSGIIENHPHNLIITRKALNYSR